MNVQTGKLGTTLLKMGVPLELTQSIICHVASSGHYDDGDICVIVDAENGGYCVNSQTAIDNDIW